MTKQIVPFLIICFTAIFLAGCSSTSPLVDEAESNLKDNNYEAALAAAEKSIQQNPDNPLGYFYKGAAIGQKASEQQDPDMATELYKQMDQAFNQAQQKASQQEEPPEQVNRIGNIRTSLWRIEHNSAVELATNDSLKKATQNPLDKAVSHLNNATMVQPDSALSFGVLAQVNNQRETYDEAAQAQQKFIEKSDSVDAKDYVLLSQFYRLDEQPKKAISTLENAREKFPENIQLVEVLADSYSQAGEAEKAIGTVEELVDQNPSNPQYRLSLGTQLYQSALKIQEEYDKNVDEIFNLQQKLRSAQGAGKEDINQQIEVLIQENSEFEQEINSISDRAITELNAAVENNPDDAVAYNTLGIIYQNKAAVIFDKRNLTNDSQEVSKLDKQAKAQLEKAMTNYERAAEIEPDNQEFWRSLFQVYTALGMDEKAKEAEKKAGMQ